MKCLKEMRNPSFCVTLKNRALHEPTSHFPEQLKKILTTDTFHHVELITVILNFLKLLSLEKTNTLIFNISENLRENRGP